MSKNSGAAAPNSALVPVSVEAAASGRAADRAVDETTFLELRRKVQDSELLSASTERLLEKMRFNGRLSIVVQNGQVVKSGYEEGYFRRKNDLHGWGGDLG
ncbi:MAG TPA: hypothetical protein VG892_06065 [Terriglobales bacterium]|nr:hypothetical protein [Terriglobales bacterium]